MKDTASKTIGEIVAEDYRTASLFKKYGIDFCCKGGRTLDEACELKNLDPNTLEAELEAIRLEQRGHKEDYSSWALDRLVNHIVSHHHHYVENAIQQIKPFLDKVCKVHGDRHPELLEIQHEFLQSAGELAMHMKKEELVLFPYILKLVKEGVHVGTPHFGTVENPINMMMQEHDTEGERFRKIAALSNNYTPPGDACNTYRVTFSMIQEFEEDLHLHIHLENNILFPGAIELENKLHVF